MFSIARELKQQIKTLRESEEGVEVSLFLHSLNSIYKINENVGTYLCSKMKNFMNNYRHKVKRSILSELRDNQIISSKVNEIIDTALKESNLEKVLEHFSDISYNSEIKDNFVLPTCKIEPVEKSLFELPCTKKSLPPGSPLNASSPLNLSRVSSSDRNGSLSENNETKNKTKRAFIQMNQESHIIHLREFNSVTILKNILTQELNLDKTVLRNAIIKSFNNTTHQWANLKSWKSFKVDGTIQIFYPTDLNKEKSSKRESGISLDTEVEDPPRSPVHEDEAVEYPLQEHIDKIINDYKSSGGKKAWVLNFQLPNFGSKLLSKMTKGDPITAKERIQICQILHDHVMIDDSHPGATEMKIIMKCLFLKHPKLAEMDKDYWVTWNVWNMTLANLFAKNKKKKKPSDVSVPLKEEEKVSTPKAPKVSKVTKAKVLKVTKEKVTNAKVMKVTNVKSTATKRKDTSLSSSSAKKPKNDKPGRCSSTPKKDDRRESLESRLNETQEEMMQSNSVSLQNASSAMDATYRERRSQIVSEGWTIEDILISYPWLHNEKEIFAEFSRITNTTKSVDEAIDIGLRKIYSALITILKSHAKSRYVLEKERELRRASRNPKDFEFKMALFAVPFALGEDVDNIFKEMGSVYEEPIQIEYAGGDSFEEAKSYSVIVEGTRIECSSLKAAISVFFASFFIYNLAYPSDVKKFLYFLERSLLKIPGKVLPPSPVVKLVAKISEYFADKGENWN